MRISSDGDAIKQGGFLGKSAGDRHVLAELAICQGHRAIRSDAAALGDPGFAAADPAAGKNLDARIDLFGIDIEGDRCGSMDDNAFLQEGGEIGCHGKSALFNGYRFGEVAGLIDGAATQVCDMVGEQLHGDGGRDGREEVGAVPRQLKALVEATPISGPACR